ncbi:MAG: hypothetical protein LBP50_06865 [Tannerella sp.]|nr:hypothetical protein [Tannerella sp.]
MDEVNYAIRMKFQPYEAPDSVPFYARTPELRGPNRFIRTHFQFPVFD